MALASESLLLFWGPCSGRQIRVRYASPRLRNRLLPRLPRPSDRHLFPTRQSCEAKPLDFEIARLAHMLFHRNLIQIPHTCFWMKGSRNRNPGNAKPLTHRSGAWTVERARCRRFLLAYPTWKSRGAAALRSDRQRYRFCGSPARRRKGRTGAKLTQR